jgi:hypothetical protein
MDGKQTEEDYLHEMLAILQESHAKAGIATAQAGTLCR